jgi:hypothetical protein
MSVGGGDAPTDPRSYTYGPCGMSSDRSDSAFSVLSLWTALCCGSLACSAPLAYA